MYRKFFCNNNLIIGTKMTPIYFYAVIFITGLLSSALMMLFVAYYYVPSVILHEAKKKNFMSEEHYLQVRDDYQIFDPNLLDPLAEHLDFTRQVKRKAANREEDTIEALSSLKVAMEMKAQGKDDKALRLFKHALALAPKNPEVLNKYGEYLEHSRADVISADLLYFQALTINPSHEAALANRQRTANIVESLDLQRLQRLDEKRDALSSIHESNAALRRAKKEAYFQNIYHSVGIEGNTMTLAQTRSILETKMAVNGKSIDEHNEILGLDSAMKYINASLVNRNDFITIKDILEVHKRVLGHVDPIEGGEFRRTQVYVGGHTPPGPGDLSILMQRFENWLNSDQAMSMHPVKHAALAHYKLVHIHPFTDGNGRTSRLLMNTILMRSGYPPVIIPKQQRHKYYDFLQIANEGDSRPFIRFIADCTEKTLDLFLWSTSELPHQVPLLSDDYSSSILNGDYDYSGSGDGFDFVTPLE